MLSELNNFVKEDHRRIAKAVPAVLLVQVLILYFADWQSVLYFNGLLSFLAAAFVYYLTWFMVNYGISLSKVKYFTLKTIGFPSAAFIAGFGLLYFLAYGANLLVVYIHTGSFNPLVVSLWFCALIFPWLLALLISQVKLYKKLKAEAQFVESWITVSHPAQLPVYIESLEFENSRSGVKSMVEFENELALTDVVKDSLKARWENRNHEFSGVGYLIPADTDQFRMTWYSFVEDKYYKDVFPFKYERFAGELTEARGKKYLLQRLFPSLLRQRIDEIHLHLKLKGDVDIFMLRGRYRGHVNYYIKVEQEEISGKKRSHFIEHYLHHTDDEKERQDFQALLGNKEVINELEQHSVPPNDYLVWKLAINGPYEFETVRVDDAVLNRYNVKPDCLAKPATRPLPEKMRICAVTEQGDDVTVELYLDSVELDRSLRQFAENQSMVFELLVEVNKCEDVTFYIKAGDETSRFSAIEVITKPQ